MTLSEVEHDGTGFEQGEIAFLVAWDLAERLNLAVAGFLQLLKGKKPNVVRLADLLKRLAHAQIARLTRALVG